MKDKLANSKTVESLIEFIHTHASRPCTIMEVCGTHTMNIARWGIKTVLPPNIHLVSGPGCPVCVTDSSMMAHAFALARLPKVIFTCFGDMLRVPAGGKSLWQMQNSGADIRIVLSPMDALQLAMDNPDREVIFFAVGFETTAPLTAATVLAAQRHNIDNFSIICAHKTMPEAIGQLLPNSSVDALICPGHVAVITGAQAFSFVANDLKRPAAITGFEASEILLAIAYLVRDIDMSLIGLHNCYPQAVSDTGNLTARDIMKQVFSPVDGRWRGLGLIAHSCLSLRDQYQAFDAVKKFAIDVEDLADDSNCICSKILRGEAAPEQCPLFRRECSPEHPVGACMVSSEGSCAAAYKYQGSDTLLLGDN